MDVYTYVRIYLPTQKDIHMDTQRHTQSTCETQNNPIIKLRLIQLFQFSN